MKEEGIKTERRTERKKEFRGKEGKKKSSAGFEQVRLVLLVFLSVEREGLVGRIGFTFLPSCATLFGVVLPQSSSSRSFCSPLGLQFTSCAVLEFHQLGATHIPPSFSLLS